MSQAQVKIDVRLGATIISTPEQKRVFVHGQDTGVAHVNVEPEIQYQNAEDAEAPDQPWEPLHAASPRNADDPLVAATREEDEQVFMNNLYTVIRSRHVYPGGPSDKAMIHLSIRRNDRRPVTDWRHKQKIKNELVGPECEGVELFPAESRMVDTSNQFHLWVSEDPGERVPVGYEDGRVTAGVVTSPTARQRPFVDNEEETMDPEVLNQMAKELTAAGGRRALDSYQTGDSHGS